MKNEEMTIKVLNDEGMEMECEVLFTFESDEADRNYIVYTDNSVDQDGSTSKKLSTIATAGFQELISSMPCRNAFPTWTIS